MSLQALRRCIHIFESVYGAFDMTPYMPDALPPEPAKPLNPAEKKLKRQVKALLKPGVLAGMPNDDLFALERLVPTDERLKELGETELLKLSVAVGKEYQYRLDNARRYRSDQKARQMIPDVELPLVKSDSDRKRIRKLLMTVALGDPRSVKLVAGHISKRRKPSILKRQRGEPQVLRGTYSGKAREEHQGAITSVESTRDGNLIIRMRDYARPGGGKRWSWTSLHVNQIMGLEEL